MSKFAIDLAAYDARQRAEQSRLDLLCERAHSLGPGAVLHVTADELELARVMNPMRRRGRAPGGPAMLLGHALCLVGD